MKINIKKLKLRLKEMLIILVTFILTILAIKYTSDTRIVQATGGEYFIPVLGFMLITILEKR